MSDPETFLTEVYVLVDDLLTPLLAAEPTRPGPAPALSPSEIVTLALMSQWARFRSGRDFYRYAEARLRPLFPTLPHRTQFLRQVLRWQAQIAQVAVAVGARLCPSGHEVLDSTAVPTRQAKRRGPGWLPGVATIGASSRLGWYEGVRLLTCVSPTGVLTGYGLAPANTNDRTRAETFFAARAGVTSPKPTVGARHADLYLADMGFGGQACETRWRTAYDATLICPPQPDRHTRRWPGALRRWLTHHRQIIESVHARLLTAFRLDANQPHSLAGLLAAVAATIALHNVTIWLTRRHGRPGLAVVDVLGW